ncbi:hypothetical protein ACFLUB_03635 [Chloroflexota bacterium]
MKDQRYLEFQEVLKESSACLVSVNGYNKLITRISRVADWDEYQSILAQINVTLWFKKKNILKEIEPELPHGLGYTDVLLYFSQQNIYCEVTSLESLPKSMESKKQDTDANKIEKSFRISPI